ncbi:MAG: hypothetical protein JNJ46_26125 [Myxococcales bacterium]|nr:hypothetical protein [Myxococcales bacterium]
MRPLCRTQALLRLAGQADPLSQGRGWALQPAIARDPQNSPNRTRQSDV